MLFKYVGFNTVHREKYFEKNLPGGSPTYLFLNIKSRAVFTFNGAQQIVEPESVILYNKGTPQHYKYYEKENGIVELYTNDHIHFDATEEEMTKIKIPLDTIIHLEDGSEITHFIERMHQVYHSNSPSKSEKLEYYFKLMLCEISDMISMNSQEDARYQANLYNLRGKIYTEEGFHPNIEWMARYINVSVSYFQYIYKKTFGISPMEDCILSRISKAKYQLKNSSSNITQLSAELGYKDPAQFIKQFKKHTGYTPLQYRKKHLNK